MSFTPSDMPFGKGMSEGCYSFYITDASPSRTLQRAGSLRLPWIVPLRLLWLPRSSRLLISYSSRNRHLSRAPGQEAGHHHQHQNAYPGEDNARFDHLYLLSSRVLSSICIPAWLQGTADLHTQQLRLLGGKLLFGQNPLGSECAQTLKLREHISL